MDDGLPVHGHPFLLLVGELSARYLDPRTKFHMRGTLHGRGKTVRSPSKTCHIAVDIPTAVETSDVVVWCTFQGLPEAMYD